MNPESALNERPPGLRVAAPEDIGAITDMHLRAFPGFFLSALGRRFLRGLYLGILADRSGIVLVATDGLRLTGFVAGTVEPGGFYGRLIKRRLPYFALTAFAPILRRPAILPRLLRALRKSAESRAHGVGAALLMSIGVDPADQRRSVGDLLLRVFCAECARRGARSVILTTDREGNDPVNRFYARRGFTLSRDYVTPEGRAMNEYSRNLLESGEALEED